MSGLEADVQLSYGGGGGRDRQTGPMYEIRRPAETRLQKLRADLVAFLQDPLSSGDTRPIADLLPQVSPDRNQAFIAPTGAGKTLALAPALLIAEHTRNKPRRIIVVEPTQGLCGDAAQTLRYFYGDDLIGHWYGGLDQERKTNLGANILVVTPGIAWNMLLRGNIADSDYVLFDEVHADMNFADTEGMIGILNKLKDDRRRTAGIGFATATIPKQEREGGFLTWTGAEVAEITRPWRYKRELVGTTQSVEQTTMNLLNDSEMKGRHLLVLRATRNEVMEAVDLVGRFTNNEFSYQSYQGGEKVEVIRYISGDSPIDFNRRVASLLSANSQLPSEYQKRLVVVSTYGAMGSGVNMPVFDAVGDGEYIAPQFEDEKGRTGVRRTNVDGSMLIQAAGRIGRFADGRFYLCGQDKHSLPLKPLEAYEPTPIRKPLEGGGLSEILLDMVAMRIDPRTIRWYSKVTPQQVDETLSFLVSHGLLAEGRLTDLARRVRKNPLSESSLYYALVAEAAPPELKAGVHLALGLVGEDWRSVFADDLTQKSKTDLYDEDGQDKVRVTTILAERGLAEVVYNGETVNLLVSESDVATIFNIFYYLRQNNIDSRDAERRYKMAPKVFQAVSRKVSSMVGYLDKKGVAIPFPLTAENWQPILRYLIEEEVGDRRQIYAFGGKGIRIVTSSGVVRDDLKEQAIAGKTGDYGRAPNLTRWAWMPAVHTANDITFTQLIGGFIPEDIIPWIPENVGETLKPLYKQLNPKHWSKTLPLTGQEESFAEVSAAPHVARLILSFDQMRILTHDYHQMDESVEVFKYDEWLKGALQPYLTRSRATTLEQLEQVLAEMERGGLAFVPDAEIILPQERRVQIEKNSPREVIIDVSKEDSLEQVTLSITYENGQGNIVLPETPIPYQDGRFMWDDHFLFRLKPEDWDTVIMAKLPLRKRGYVMKWPSETYATLWDIKTSQQSAVYRLGLESLVRLRNTQQPNEPVLLKKGVDLETLLQNVGMEYVGDDPWGDPLYVSYVPKTGKREEL